MMINLIKTKIEEAVRAKDTTASNIFKLVLSECQRVNKEDDDFIVKFMGKIVEGNNETLKYRADEKLVRENDLLRPYLPILIDRAGVILNASKITDSIKNARMEGQAIGALSKHLKQLGLDFNIEDVKYAVSTIRECTSNV